MAHLTPQVNSAVSRYLTDSAQWPHKIVNSASPLRPANEKNRLEASGLSSGAFTGIVFLSLEHEAPGRPKSGEAEGRYPNSGPQILHL